jgi:integrase
MTKGLTAIAVQNLKPGPTRREIPDPGARGLYVLLQPSGKTSYAVRYRFAGKTRKLTLKAGISLAAARKAAADALYEVEQGRDPSTVKKDAKSKAAAAAADTVESICTEYLAREGKRLRTAGARKATLKRLVYPTLGRRPIASVTRTELIRLLDKIEDEKGPRMADMTLAIVRKVMNWHATRTDDFRSPVVRGMARVKTSEQARSRTLTDDELRAVWRVANERPDPFSALVRFLLLTAARRSEAAAMKREEFDGGDWTLPAGRNKTKLDLVRPLSEMAQAVLDARPQIGTCPYVFTTDGRAPLSGFSKFKKHFDKACGVTNWTLHDLRRTARSIMSRAGVNADHAERCLGHVIGGVRGVYDRHEYHDEKRKAFEALAAQIARIIDPPKGNVTKLPRRG